MPRPPRPTFQDYYRKYKREGVPRWLYVIYFLVLLAGAIAFYLKAPPCWRPGSSGQPCSDCSKQPRPVKPEAPKILRVF